MGMEFKLPSLPYDFDYLEPVIDKETMHLHYEKHHNAYKNKLNATIKKLDLKNHSIVHIIIDIDAYNINKVDRQSIIFNGGGYYNHALYWNCMNKNSNYEDLDPKIREKIEETFGGYEQLKKSFNEKAAVIQGSGWQWLCYNAETKQLNLQSTSNQDTPLSSNNKNIPILACDVWEHAYYLKYKNERVRYLDNWWNIIDWKNVDVFYNSFAAQGHPVDFDVDGNFQVLDEMKI